MTWSYEHTTFSTLSDGYNSLNIGDIIDFELSHIQAVVCSLDRQKNLIIAYGDCMSLYLELLTDSSFKDSYEFMLLPRSWRTT